MRVVLSVDMEGISQLAEPREILSCRQEYWATGKPRIASVATRTVSRNSFGSFSCCCHSR